MFNFIHKFITSVAIAVTAFTGALSSHNVNQNPIATTTPPTIISTSTPKSTFIPLSVKHTTQSQTVTNTTKSSVTKTAPTSQPQIINNTTPAPVVPTQPSTQAISPNNNTQDLSDFYSFIDQAISGLKDTESQVQSFSSQVRSDIVGIGNTVPDIASTGNLTLSACNALINEIESSVTTLRVAKNQAVSTGSVDMQYWNNTGISEAVNKLKYHKQELLDLENLYNQRILQIKQSVSTQQSYTSQTTQQPVADPAQMYKDCANEEQKANQEVLAGFSGGGFATQSQINALTVNKMKSEGFGYCFYLQ
jgi:hypothetical protein